MERRFPSPAANNGDKEIETDFVTAGLQYMFNSSWGCKSNCLMTTAISRRTYNGNIVAQQLGELGDIRVEGIYTGFSRICPRA